MRYSRRTLIFLATIAAIPFVYVSQLTPVTHPKNTLQQSVVDEYDLALLNRRIDLGPVIPGLNQHAIPQGLAYAPEHDRILVSHYANNGPSFVSVIDETTGEFLYAVGLQDNDGADHTGHVGGIAIHGDRLFVASDSRTLTYPLSPFVSATKFTTAIAVAKTRCETSADFATVSDDTLFVGEYAYGSYYATDESHHLTDRTGAEKRAWVCAYELGEGNAAVSEPDYVFSIPDCVQGMAIADDKVFLSMSFGRRYNSKIYVFGDPRRDAAHDEVKLSDGSKAPLWFLDDENLIETIELPPMAEGIAVLEKQLAVLMESAAKKYRFLGAKPIDRILLIELENTVLDNNLDNNKEQH